MRADARGGGRRGKSARYTCGIRTRAQAAGRYGGKRAPLRTPGDAARLLIPRFRDLTHEVFAVLVLDTQNAVVATLSSCRWEPSTRASSPTRARCSRRPSIYVGAAVIVVHNHPSGNPEPSGEDIAITHQLAGAGKILGIPLHDHLIIAGNGYVSLAERGHIP